MKDDAVSRKKKKTLAQHEAQATTHDLKDDVHDDVHTRREAAGAYLKLGVNNYSQGCSLQCYEQTLKICRRITYAQETSLSGVR